MKKLLLMLMGAVSIFAAPSASAYTASDLIGKKCGVLVVSSNIQYDSERDHFTCDVVAGSSSDQIILKDFLGSFDLPVTVNSDNSLTIQTASSFTGTKGKYDGYTITFGKRTPKEIYYYWESLYAAYVDIDGYAVYAEYYEPTTGNYTTEAAVADSPYYDFMYELNNGLYGFYFKYTKGSTTEYEALGGLKFCFFDAADKTTEYVNGVAVKSYDVDLELNGNNVSLTNLFNSGIMFVPTVKSTSTYDYVDIQLRAITGTIDYANKTITLDSQQIGGGIRGGTFGIKTYDAYSYNSSTGYYTYRATKTGMWEVDTDDMYCDHHTLTSGTDANFAAVTGTFDYLPAHKNHNNNYWVSDGGTTETSINMDITLGRAGYYSSYNSEIEQPVIPYYADRINIKKENAEVTHAVDLVLNKVGVNDEYLYVNAEIVPGADESRNQFVDHYELCVAPGNHDNISNFTTDKELGHINGTNLYNKHNSDWTPSTANRVAARVESTDALVLNKMIKLSDLKSRDANGKYTFYVKTVYKDNQIEPTFHSLSYVSNPTSIDDVEIEGSDVNITAGTGVIEISGAEHAEVYPMSGAQVYAGGEGTVAVAKGIYVVKADGVVKKVTVK